MKVYYVHKKNQKVTAHPVTLQIMGQMQHGANMECHQLEEFCDQQFLELKCKSVVGNIAQNGHSEK